MSIVISDFEIVTEEPEPAPVPEQETSTAPAPSPRPEEVIRIHERRVERLRRVHAH